MQDENIVRLYVFSVHKTAEQIAENIGLHFDKSWRIGDKRGKSIIMEKENGWALNSNLPKSAPLDLHIEKLLERLSPYKDKIRMLAQNDTVQFSCIIHTANRPPLHFSKTIVKEIYQLGASLDVDLYFVEVGT
jgi:hypothetical protein